MLYKLRLKKLKVIVYVTLLFIKLLFLINRRKKKFYEKIEIKMKNLITVTIL